MPVSLVRIVAASVELAADLSSGAELEGAAVCDAVDDCAEPALYELPPHAGERQRCGERGK